MEHFLYFGWFFTFKKNIEEESVILWHENCRRRHIWVKSHTYTNHLPSAKNNTVTLIIDASPMAGKGYMVYYFIPGL